jgi:hypothetical protein
MNARCGIPSVKLTVLQVVSKVECVLHIHAWRDFQARLIELMARSRRARTTIRGPSANLGAKKLRMPWAALAAKRVP